MSALVPRLLNGSRAYRNVVVLCDAPPAEVNCEKVYHYDNRWRYPARDQLTTPLLFGDVASTDEIVALEKRHKAQTFEETTVATQLPSDWLFPAAIRQSNSNHPIEDRGVIATLPYTGTVAGSTHPARPWMMAAVIDGHSGWQTAEFVAKNLSQYVTAKLIQIPGSLTAEKASAALTSAFLDLDNTIKAKVDGAVSLGHSGAAKPGATTVCCLMNGQSIIVANIGDSRGYLYRDGKPIPLSACHNAGDPEESAKLRAGHPGEPDIIKCKECVPNPEHRVVRDPPDNQLLRILTNLHIHDFSNPRPAAPACYTKGRLQLTRAFGDFYLKEAKYANDWNSQRLMVGQPHSFPYVTAKPEITILEQDPEDDDLIILASDGVWDELTPGEACRIARDKLEEGSASDAATAVQEAVFERVAWRENTTKADLIKLPPRERRGHVDDITCIVIDLKRRDRALSETSTVAE